MSHTPAGRLRPEVVRQLHAGKEWPVRDAFLKHVRETTHRAYTPHWWVRVRGGESVPLHLLECLHHYLRDRRRLPWVGTFLDFAERVDGPARLAPPAGRGADAWRYGWVKLLGLLPSWPHLPQEALASADDIPDVARMILADLGRGDGPPPADALAAGERRLGVSAEAYADWLLGFWRKHPETVLFATIGDPHQGFTRAGVWVALPLTEDAYRRLSGGHIRPLDLTPADCPRLSRYQYVEACGELAPVPDINLGRSLLQCGLWQSALFLPPVRDVMRGVTAVIATVHRPNIVRARSHGFRPTGQQTPTGLPLLELRPPADWPDRPPLAERCGYAALCAILRILQEVQAADRERLCRSE